VSEAKPAAVAALATVPTPSPSTSVRVTPQAVAVRAAVVAPARVGAPRRRGWLTGRVRRLGDIEGGRR
jgi:hypothetical protein